MASLEYPKLWRLRLGQPKVINVANAAAALNYREWCYLNSGEVDQLVAASTNWASTGNTALGMVERTVSGATDTNVPVLVFTEDLELLLPKTTNAGASASLAETQLGSRFTVYNGATRGNMSATSDTANPTVECTEFYGGHSATEAFGWGWYKLIEAEAEIGG